MTIKKKSLGKISILVITVCALYGCANSISRPVTESQKDTQGTYDGLWVADVLSTAGNSGRSYDIKVKDGKASMTRGGKEVSSYVNSDGQFRLEAPFGQVRSTGSSGFRINNNNITVIMTGSLSESKGIMTIGYEEFDNRGCNSKVSFKRA